MGKNKKDLVKENNRNKTNLLLRLFKEKQKVLLNMNVRM